MFPPRVSSPPSHKQWSISWYLGVLPGKGGSYQGAFSVAMIKYLKLDSFRYFISILEAEKSKSRKLPISGLC